MTKFKVDWRKQEKVRSFADYQKYQEAYWKKKGYPLAQPITKEMWERYVKGMQDGNKAKIKQGKEHPNEYWVDYNEDGLGWTGEWMTLEEIKQMKETNEENEN